MDRRGKAGHDQIRGLCHHGQIAVTLLGRRKIRRYRDESKAGRAAFEPVEPLAYRFRRYRRRGGQRFGKLRGQAKQPLLAQQRDELRDMRLVDLMHGAEPRGTGRP
jgi:hypothetical protein